MPGLPRIGQKRATLALCVSPHLMSRPGRLKRRQPASASIEPGGVGADLAIRYPHATCCRSSRTCCTNSGAPAMHERDRPGLRPCALWCAHALASEQGPAVPPVELTDNVDGNTRPTVAFIRHAGAVLASHDEEVSGALRGRRLAAARRRRRGPGPGPARPPGTAGPR